MYFWLVMLVWGQEGKGKVVESTRPNVTRRVFPVTHYAEIFLVPPDEEAEVSNG
jgi:hypothetical protein